VNPKLRIFSTDQPDSKGAHSDYLIEVPNAEGSFSGYTVRFHCDDHIAGSGETNGATDEALLMIVADRLFCKSKAAGDKSENYTKLKFAHSYVLQALEKLGADYAHPVNSRDEPEAAADNDRIARHKAKQIVDANESKLAIEK
jgi:hypothetical protein